jgi:hypothetical protein
MSTRGVSFRRRLAKGASIALFGVAFAINPALLNGCSLVSFSFGEKEMVGLLDAANGRRFTFRQGTGEYELELKLEQDLGADKLAQADGVAVTREALACSDRTFLRSAGACLDTTTMPLAGIATLRRSGEAKPLLDAVAVKGSLEVIGRRIDNADLDLNSDSVEISLDSRDGKTFELGRVSVGREGDANALHYAP